MRLGLPVGVDLQGPQPVGDGRPAVADGAAEQVGERVGGVGGDEQAAPAAARGDEAEGRRGRRLADAALASDEEEGKVQDRVEQDGAPWLAAAEAVEGRVFQALPAMPVVKAFEQYRLQLQGVVGGGVRHAHELGEDE